MKKSIIMVTGLAVIVGVAGFTQMSSIMEVTSVEKEEIIKEVRPEWATDEEAVKAAQDVIRRKQLEAELSALESNFEATTATFEAEKAAYKENKTRIEKELGVY